MLLWTTFDCTAGTMSCSSLPHTQPWVPLKSRISGMSSKYSRTQLALNEACSMPVSSREPSLESGAAFARTVRTGAFLVRWFCRFAIVLAVGFPSACHHDSALETKRDPAVLDGMELTAARRVGLESARDAMERGDLKRLKMLSVWVRSRAQVVLLEPQDVESLDRAIACLENNSTRSAELTAQG